MKQAKPLSTVVDIAYQIVSRCTIVVDLPTEVVGRCRIVVKSCRFIGVNTCQFSVYQYCQSTLVWVGLYFSIPPPCSCLSAYNNGIPYFIGIPQIECLCAICVYFSVVSKMLFPVFMRLGGGRSIQLSYRRIGNATYCRIAEYESQVLASRCPAYLSLVSSATVRATDALFYYSAREMSTVSAPFCDKALMVMG